jgi:hypothetical protein
MEAGQRAAIQYAEIGFPVGGQLDSRPTVSL